MNVRRHAVIGSMCALAASGSLPYAALRADGAPTTSKHQLMKECMAKQKASDSGMPKEQMKKNCRDVIGVEKENAAVEKQADDKPAVPIP